MRRHLFAAGSWIETRQPPPKESHLMSFASLGLSQAILKTLASLNLKEPTPIQSAAIPAILAGEDVVGLAQTGTGKTAAFVLPILERLAPQTRAAPQRPQVLILSPTRELAVQISQSLKDLSRGLDLRQAFVVGGLSIRMQMKTLSGRVDILVATPGRLIDLLEQKALTLDAVKTVVLDEADQMMDIGFMPAIRRILKLTPNSRQTLLFSATMPKEIRALAAAHLKNPREVAVTPVARTADKIEQSVIAVPASLKPALLTRIVTRQGGGRVIVFTRTKHGADKAVRRLGHDGIEAAAIHGNKSQGQRQRALDAFRDGSVPVLVATDIAARGIDVAGVELVVNYELPQVPEAYVHRIGRTARAGASGQAISFVAPDERSQLRAIERLIRMPVPVDDLPEGLEATVEKREPRGDRENRPSRESRPHRKPRPAAAGDATVEVTPDDEARTHKPKKNKPFTAGNRNNRDKANRHQPGAAAGEKANGPARKGSRRRRARQFQPNKAA